MNEIDEAGWDQEWRHAWNALRRRLFTIVREYRMTYEEALDIPLELVALMLPPTPQHSAAHRPADPNMPASGATLADEVTAGWTQPRFGE